MKKIIVLMLLVVLTSGCFSGKARARAQSASKNILLICIDDLRPELNSFGVSYIKSPNIDQLAKAGMSFYNHYVNAPSCGPSRYTLLTGRYGTAGNDALFIRSKKLKEQSNSVPPSMPEWFHVC